MAESHELEALNKAFSGFGVDEKALISVLGKWHPEQRQSFRKGSKDMFKEDERQFERWNDRHVMQLRLEFLRLKEVVLLWTMHPWERDARLVKEALTKGPQYNILIEVACTRSSDELLGARRAYHSLFHHSIEEDVTSRIHGPEKKLLVGLLSSYRYEGPKMNEETPKSEAQALSKVIKKGASVLEDEHLITILSTRNKPHIRAMYKHYKEITGNYLDEDLDGNAIVKEAVQCLCVPQTYFSEVLNGSLRYDVDETIKDGVSRVVATRADVDMKEIKEEYNKKFGQTLSKKIEEICKGSYKDFLLTLIARGD